MQNDTKRVRVEKAAAEARARLEKNLRSLQICLARSDVMRLHHDALVQEVESITDRDAFTNAKKARFFTYIAFWFTALCGVIERYEQLRNSSNIPSCPEVDALVTAPFKDLLKPFRNSVAHCSDHDDARTLEIFEHEATLPDHATAISVAFHKYFKQHLLAAA